MINSTSKSGIILPGSFSKKKEEGPEPLQMMVVEFPFDDEKYILEFPKPESFLKSPPEQQTQALDRELRSSFNLQLLLSYAIAKDLVAAGHDPKNFKKLCETIGLTAITIDGKQIDLVKSLEKL